MRSRAVLAHRIASGCLGACPGRRGDVVSEARTSRSSWHLRAGSVVVAWLVAVLVIAHVHPFVPGSRWLLVHLLVLGAASNAILIWSMVDRVDDKTVVPVPEITWITPSAVRKS